MLPRSKAYTQSGHPEERPPWVFQLHEDRDCRMCRTFLRERPNEVSGSFDTPRAMAGSSDLRNVGRILRIRQEAKFEEFLEFVSGCRTRRHGRAPGRYREPFRRVTVPIELAVVSEKFCGLFPISSATQAASGNIDKG